MGYAEDAMAELHGYRIRDNTPPTLQSEPSYLQAGVLLEVAKELAKARATHAPMNGHHEGYAVILEELDELWEVCKRNTHANHIFGKEPQNVERERSRKRADMRKEAIQVAAMAIRFIEDVCDKKAAQ
jgi:hypothetical protein